MPGAAPADRATMPVLRIAARRGTRIAYQAAIDRVDLDHNHPLGLISHATGEIDGRIHVAQIWESEVYARDFLALLEPVLVAEGVPPPDDEVIMEIQHLVTP